MAKEAYLAYLQLLAELKEQIDSLVGVENRKLEAVHKDDLLAVDECIRQEQAISLALRSLDVKRDKMLQELGLAGVRLSGLAAAFPAELQRQAGQSAEALRRSYQDYTSISEAARMALERGLREIERMMQPPQGEAGPQAQAPTGGEAPEGDEPPHKKLDCGA